MTSILENNNDANIYNIQFINSNTNDIKFNTDFIGTSDIYKNSFIYGIINVDRISVNDDNTFTYNYFIEMNINSIHCDLSGLVVKSSNVEFNLNSIWNLIFSGGKKTVIGTNTKTDNNQTENDQYKISVRSTTDEFNITKLFIYVDEYIWPHDLLSDLSKEPSEIIIECLNNPTIVKIIDSDGNKLVFNNNENFNSNKKYALNTGTYKFNNIPETHPIALLHDNTGKIGYIGDENKVMYKTFNNLSYPYYYGNIDVIVAQDFGQLTIDTYYDGELNGSNLIVFNSDCDSTLQITNSAENNEQLKGPPSEIIGKSYYYELYDFVNQQTYISAFEFGENILKIYFYSDYSLTDYVRLEEHSNSNMSYNPTTRLLILDVNDGFIPYILPSQQQGTFNRKIETMVFNEDFSYMATNTTYLGLYEPEVTALAPYLQSNNWIVNLDELYIVTTDKLHYINPPIDPNNQQQETDIPDILDGYFPPEIIGKTYYFDLFDFVNQTNYISTFIFSEDKLTEIFYNDYTLSEINRSNEYPIGNFLYYTKTRNLILEENYDTDQYIIPLLSQGIFTKKLTSLTFNENFTVMVEFEQYKNMYPTEVIAFKPLLEANGWTILDNDTTSQTGIKTHTLNLPNLPPGNFPPQIIDKNFYAWTYDNVNQQYYLTTYIFKKDKLTEIFYNDETFTDYTRIFEYPVSNVIFDSTKQTLILSVKYDEEQFIIPASNQGRFNEKQKTLIFNQDFTTFTESDRYLGMYLPEINAFLPVMEALSWNWSLDDLWVEFSWLGDGQSFGLNIPKKPDESVEILIESDSKLQCLNKGLVNNFSIGKNSNGENVILFNNVPYDLNDNIGLGIGFYIINGIPEDHPLGFVINNESKFKVLEGKEFGINIIDGLFVMHYVGNIRFQVLGDFGKISYNCYNNGYMGGKNRLKFISTC